MIQHYLGFSIKVLNEPLRSHDSRRWQNQPHLSVSLAYLRDILEYLHRKDIHFYRLSGQLAPYLTHPDFPQFHHQIDECTTELASIGDLARQYGVRLTMHPGYYIQLSSPDDHRVERSIQELNAATRLLDAMGLDSAAVIVIHGGGLYGDMASSRERFVQNFFRLPPSTQQRLGLENDERCYSLQDTFWLYEQTGIRLVLDTLHHHCLSSPNNHHPYTLTEALSMALSTWPPDQRPKIHFSSPRTAVRHLYRNGKLNIQIPHPNQHSDFIHPFEFIELLHQAQKAQLRPFDIMLEAKGKDIALLQLRAHIANYAPQLANQIQ